MTPDDLIDTLDEPRRSETRRLHDLIRSTAPELEPFVMGKMIGYGPYHYRYATGREGDSAVVSVASQKRHISLYVSCADADGYLAERYRDRLPKADIGKGCVRIKKVGDLDQEARRDLIRKAARMGGASAVP